MKKILSILIITFTLNSFSQDYSKIFLGDDFALYKGCQFIIDTNFELSLSFKFYRNIENCQKPYDKNILYSDNPGSFAASTMIDSLKNKVFTVNEIVNKENKVFEGKASSFNKPIFRLINNKGDTLHYIYNSKASSFSFPFLSTEPKFNLDYFCNKLTREVDDMTDEIKISSPHSSTFKINKYIEKDKTTYYLSLRAIGSTAVVDGTGVIILFTDGTKMKKSSEIDVDVSKYGYEYSSFIRLTDNDLKILSKKEIKKIRLYIFDRSVGEQEGKNFKHFVKCISNMN